MTCSAPRIYSVACKGCGRTLCITPRIRDDEIALMLKHLGACDPTDLLGASPQLGEVMRRFAVLEQA